MRTGAAAALTLLDPTSCGSKAGKYISNINAVPTGPTWSNLVPTLYVEEWDLERTTLHIWEERKLVDQVGYVGTQLILLAFFWSRLVER